MRTHLAGLALAALAATAVSGCASSGTPLAAGALPNGTGGGPVSVTNQPPAPGTIASVLLDTVPGPYTGFNVTGVTSAAGPDPLAGAPASPSKGSGPLPVDPGSSQVVTYPGNGLLEEIFKLGTPLPPLLLPAVSPGQISALAFGAIVFYAVPPAVPGGGAFGPGLSLELTGGSGSTSYDGRVGCATTGVANANGFLRYVCDLPAYGGASGTYVTKYGATPGAFSGSYAGPAVRNPVVSNALGTFTPIAATLYVVVTYAAPTDPATIGTLDLGYVYAEQGTQ